MKTNQTTDTANTNQIATTFDARSLGGSFKEVAVDVIRGETTDFVSRWFKAARGDADLTIWVDGEHRIVKHQLSFFGQVVEWNPIQGTRTGFIVEVESAAVTSHSGHRSFVACSKSLGERSRIVDLQLPRITTASQKCSRASAESVGTAGRGADSHR